MALIGLRIHGSIALAMIPDTWQVMGRHARMAGMGNSWATHDQSCTMALGWEAGL